MNLQKTCRVDSCENTAAKRGLCNAHYIRLRRHGDLEFKIKMFRERTSHPEYSRWVSVRKWGCVERWDDFTIFLQDIGENPGPHYRIRKITYGEPYGPSNFRWTKDKSREEQAEAKRVVASNDYYRRKLDGLAAWSPVQRNSYYKKKFGITLEQYEELLTKQNHQCAICENTDTRRLAVDHCHTTGVVRGLLCSSCNISIGRFQDDVSRLERAISYLKKSAHPL